MLTAAARRLDTTHLDGTVTTRRRLSAAGFSEAQVRAAIDARRWHTVGGAVVLHNAEPTRDEWAQIALVNHGPRSALTSFTAAEDHGLQGWERKEIHVVVPAGARVTSTRHSVTHWTGDWRKLPRHPVKPAVAVTTAVLAAASSFASPRPACGILAAAVQQRLTRAPDLASRLQHTPRLRHRAQLMLAMADIAQGANALSEIDFRRLCARHGLPLPEQQSVRVERSGRRRYLDASWRCASGRRLVAEVDGAIHLRWSRWVPDQVRQNEIVIAGEPVLRFPSVLVRTDETLVADQLRRALANW